MPTFREMKHQAREQLHEALAEPVYYFADPSADAVIVTARLHLSFRALGALSGGGSQGYAAFEEITPKARFLIAELSPSNDAIIVTKYNGAFVVEYVHPPDGLTVDAQIADMTKGNIVRYGAERYNWQPGQIWCGMPEPSL